MARGSLGLVLQSCRKPVLSKSFFDLCRVFEITAAETSPPLDSDRSASSRRLTH